MVGGRRHWEIRILHRMTVRFSGRQLRGAEKWRRVGKPGFRQVRLPAADADGSGER
jgi:hypothetical protein